ncbi:MAG: group III truncated hemoglobin [Chakrabartia sp.]
MKTSQYAIEARARKQADAASIGIDEAFVSELVDTFYARIQTHGALGPIFNRHVKDWPYHLSRMKDFWASVALESGRFHGNPMLKHIAIQGLGADQFLDWLALWDDVLADISPNHAVTDFFSERAHRIATSLQLGIDLHKGGMNALMKEK